MAYELPAETGEARLHRLRNRRRRIGGALLVGGAALAMAAWLWASGTIAEEGWSLLWFLPLLIVGGLLQLGFDSAFTPVWGWFASPIARTFTTRSYSAPAPSEPPPDWSGAERIPESDR